MKRFLVVEDEYKNDSTFRRHSKLYASCVFIKIITIYDIDRKEEN